MEKVDVRGLSCPMPVLKTKKVIDSGAKEILVVGTSQVSKENVTKLARSHGYEVIMKVDQKDSWEMELRK
ncbi:TusA-related sulfurtransferase [Thermosyntropha lipolytica DSM 11003]|uniref:TusA-related sulfurtransferase n=1 Tax=Thermosyntropha lipolytica DSM 11003 TaxID=1123382 RepID=A0A1M5QN90_9FIRM|nr:sulfurtransferase TusA family protein [Thermosyntropha lipolytica]SHH15351.1 TusA-related sulfurtransferase [Thermosyntropha lipolytica DSM 11003]